MSYTDGQLTNISELGDFTRGYKGTGGAYTYDNMGNMTHDANKGLTIDYNFLNLPHRFVNSEGTMTVNYDATGVKWSRTVSGEGIGYTQWYIDGIEYRTEGTTTHIEAIYNEAGRYVYTEGVGSYEYTLRDHLGNTRVTFSDANADGTVSLSEVLDEHHYYAFGMEMENAAYAPPVGADNRYNFNGIEHVKELGLDLAAFRAYDPTVGRWWQVDPLAEHAYNITSYRFGFNNPITNIDPLGLFETRKEARRYRKEHGLKGSLDKNEDGTWSINDKKGGTSTTRDREFGLETAALITAQKKNESDQYGGQYFEAADWWGDRLEIPIGLTSLEIGRGISRRQMYTSSDLGETKAMFRQRLPNVRIPNTNFTMSATAAARTAKVLKVGGRVCLAVGLADNAKDIIDGNYAKGITGALVTGVGLVAIGTFGAPAVAVIIGTAIYAIIIEPAVFGD